VIERVTPPDAGRPVSAGAVDFRKGKWHTWKSTKRLLKFVKKPFCGRSHSQVSSSDISLIVKDAVSAVIDKVEGGKSKKKLLHLLKAIEGVSSWRRQSLVKTQAEVK